MAEYRQYIAQPQNDGAIMISEDVIAAIVEHSVTEVDGVVGLNMKTGADIADMIGKKSWRRGIKIVINEDNAVSIECNIVIAYGQSVVDVAKALQDTIFSAVTTITNAEILKINVNVCGIQRQ